ncbi:MAG: single-stranded-DNA-specific exonuclease RecJ, partial [Proteobacteria bacterium]|nr:single-stranded-DNA-specific exonuclease RecJ [Pseudomonadota bacterium]
MTQQKRWKIPAVDSEKATELSEKLSEELSEALGVSPVVAALLVRRGMTDVGSASAFLSPDIKDLHDPMKLTGMARAAERLAAAVIEGERIALYGDYDVDGTTSVALMTLFFNALGVEPLCHIPDRVSEGYGLNTAAVESLAEQGAHVVITADCGSTNHAEVARAAALGVDV